MNTVLVGILIYVALQLIVGVLVSRRIKNEEDYLVAGRSLGYGLATFSFFATWFGAETCVSSAGGLYEHGLAGGSAEPFGYGLCVMFMGFVFAVPLWKRKLTTLADLFRQRYSASVERLAVLILAPTSIFWAAAQIRAFGQVLSASTQTGLVFAILIAAAVAIVYTVLGGLRADVITDVIQGAVIIIGLIILFVIVLGEMGGLSAAWATVEPERRRLFGGEDVSIWDTLETWMVPICGSVVAQELVARVVATRSPEIAKRSAIMGGGLYLLIGLIPAFLGLVGLSLLPNLDDPEQILPLLAQQHLSTFFYIIFVGALVSAILSTVDSSLLAAASLISHNLIVPFRPAMSEAAKVRTARIGVAVCGVIACALALSAESIYELVESSSAFGGAGLFIIMVFGLFSGFGKWRSALAALISSALVWGFGTYVAGFEYSFIASFAVALPVYLVVGRIERR